MQARVRAWSLRRTNTNSKVKIFLSNPSASARGLHNDWDVEPGSTSPRENYSRISHSHLLHRRAGFLGQPSQSFPRSTQNILFLKLSHFSGESLVPEPANEEQEGSVRGRDAHRGSRERSQRRRFEGGWQPDWLRGGGGLCRPPPATSPPPWWTPSSSPSPCIGSSLGPPWVPTQAKMWTSTNANASRAKSTLCITYDRLFSP